MTYVEPAVPSRRSILIPILIGCGVIALLVVAAIAVLIWAALSSPEGGVKMANEMQTYALDYLAKQRILNGTEQLVAYYDATLSMTGTEAAILTTERLMYHKDGRTTAIPLADIAEVQHRYETLTGDIIEVVASDGQRMKIEIAPLNGGESFVEALNYTRKRATPARSPAPKEERKTGSGAEVKP
jgi:hypothetical protein